MWLSGLAVVSVQFEGMAVCHVDVHVSPLKRNKHKRVTLDQSLRCMTGHG